MCIRFRQSLCSCAVLGACWATGQPLAAEPLPAPASVILTNVAQVRDLTPAEASNRVQIRIRGVVLDMNPGGNFCILDDTAGLYGEGPASVISGFGRGDLIEVQGVSNPGKFAPYLDARMVRKLGVGRIPDPQIADQEALFSGRLDAQWIEVSGIVRRVESDRGGLDFEVNLEPGGGRIHVRATGSARTVAVDSTVRLRGVCFYQFNKTRQALKPYLAIPQGEPVIVTEPATTNLSALPVRSIASLMQFGAGQTKVHRVRVRGVVLHAQPGDGFWLRDVGHSLRVVCDGNDLPGVGAEVDVFGFVKQGEYGPMLDDVSFRKTGKTLSVPPIHLTEAVQALDHDSDLVECEAIIRELWPALDGCRLKLSDGATEFPAVLRMTNQNTLPKAWLPGTRVRVAGVCSVGFLSEPFGVGTLQPQVFKILLRSPSDVLILQRPSWWTAEHVAWLMGAAALMLTLVAGLIVWISHRRLRREAMERMKSEAEFAAVWNERNRLARELHDTLAQGLGAISLQLEVAKRRLPADSDARASVEEAGGQTRASLAEVRDAIWNMRSQVLETGDLASALNGVLHSMVDRGQIKSELRVIGEPRRFAPVVENNLLRIGQEAITNAAKHARAGRIEVVLNFEERQFELCVSDDGQGFDPSHPPASEGGFGLVGMRERAAALNGTLHVHSAPGMGCAIKFTLPLSTA